MKTYGARFFATDAVALLAGAALTVLLDRVVPESDRWLVGVPAAALGHFFLFCNVFRVRRRYELVWTATFLANVLAFWTLSEVSWLTVLAIQTPFTAVAIGLELRSPEYHGVAARRINPRLDEWLSSR